MDKKYKMFLHKDLDGIGCAVLAKEAFVGDTIDIEYCDYKDINERVTKFLESEDHKNYDMVFILDISVKEDVAAQIDKLSKEVDKFILKDHHETVVSLNEYDWAEVDVETEELSGTTMFYEYLKEKGYYDDVLFRDKTAEEDFDIYVFAQKVMRYDTWLWANKYDDLEAKQLNDLFYLYGINKFVDKMVEFLDIGDWYFDRTFIDKESKFLLEIEQNKIDATVRKREKQMTIANIAGFKAGIVFSENYINEIAHSIQEKHPEIDFMVVINMASGLISYRTDKPEKVNVGKIAEKMGGGGRAATSGSEIKQKDIIAFALDLLKKIED